MQRHEFWMQDRTYCNWGTIPGSADPGVIGVIGVAGPIVWWMFTLPIFSVRSVIGAIGDMRLCCWIQINVEIVSHLNRIGTYRCLWLHHALWRKTGVISVHLFCWGRHQRWHSESTHVPKRTHALTHSTGHTLSH